MKNALPFLLGIMVSVFSAGGVMADTGNTKMATFAGGCFWCMQGEYDNVPGVTRTVVGYTGGTVKNPTYEQVSGGDTGHFESIQVTYDPAKVSYQKLLDIFWENIDPLDPYGQFCDKGSQYRAGIFYHDDEQKELAEESREKMSDKFGQTVKTIIAPASPFYVAENYHQEYYIKNKERYKRYRLGCGRDARLKELWNK